MRALVAAAALAAAAVAALVAWTGRVDDAGASGGGLEGPRSGAPPLELDLLDTEPGLAAVLRSAEQLYDDGRRAAAHDAFERALVRDPASVPAAVGAALATWPDGTTARLEQLAAEHPESGLIQLHLGLALLWNRQDARAEAAWKRAEEVEPDSASAVRAESLLHPDQAPGRPFFVPGEPFPADVTQLPPLDQLEELRRRAEAEASAGAWILYAAALQRAGKVVSAVDAFDRAAELAPDDPVALTGAAVARFDKDDPSQAFSRLGPLSRRFPQATVIRFHLGLCLLWLRDVPEATTQLEQAAGDPGGSVWARQAQQLLDELARRGSSG